MSDLPKLFTSLLLMIYYCFENLILMFIPKKLRYKDITGETVLITGGGNGLGRLFALRFASLGARVILWDIDRKSNEDSARLVREIGGEAHTYQCDVSNRKAVYEVATKVKDEVGKVTILINNAGIVTGKRFLDCPDEKIEKTFHVNTLSNFWTLKAFLPDMMESNHGHLIFISSMAGLCGVVRLTDYCASKHAVVGLAESVRLELQTEGYNGIYSTVICPYFTNTGLFAGASPGLLSMLDPTYVVDQAIAATLINQEILVLPKIFNLLLWLRSWVPVSATTEALSTLGITKCMLQFEGRKQKAV